MPYRFKRAAERWFYSEVVRVSLPAVSPRYELDGAIVSCIFDQSGLGRLRDDVWGTADDDFSSKLDE